MEEQQCKSCGGATEGFKCELCGDNCEKQNSDHECGDAHAKVKCKNCKETEEHCVCKH